MKKLTNPTNDEHRQIFENELKYWQNKLGMQDWRIVLSKIPDKHNMASVTRDLASRLAAVKFGVAFGAEELSEKNISSTALHELLHVFLWELITICKKPDLTAEELYSAEHRIIHILENLLIEKK